MTKISRALLALATLCGALHAADTLKTSIAGDALSINGNDMKLGASHWAKPEESWRTVGELAKTALPPADKATGIRPVTLVVDLDEKASWGALKTLLLASANLGVPKAEIHISKDETVSLDLPGEEAKGETVDFPLVAGDGGAILTENRGQKLPCSMPLISGMVQQVGAAVVVVKAPVALRAAGVAHVLGVLTQCNAHISFLPVRAATNKEAAEQKQAKDAVDKALEGTVRGLSK